MRLMPLEDVACDSEKDIYEPSEASCGTATPKNAIRNLGEHWSTRVHQLRQIFEAGRAHEVGPVSPQQACVLSSSSAAALPEVPRLPSASEPSEELGTLRDLIRNLQQRMGILQAQVEELECRFTPERLQELIEATLAQDKRLHPNKPSDKEASVSDERLTPRFTPSSFKTPRISFSCSHGSAASNGEL